VSVCTVKTADFVASLVCTNFSVVSLRHRRGEEILVLLVVCLFHF
jgi:hypothetical protein